MRDSGGRGQARAEDWTLLDRFFTVTPPLGTLSGVRIDPLRVVVASPSLQCFESSTLVADYGFLCEAKRDEAQEDGRARAGEQEADAEGR